MWDALLVQASSEFANIGFALLTIAFAVVGALVAARAVRCINKVVQGTPPSSYEEFEERLGNGYYD